MKLKRLIRNWVACFLYYTGVLFFLAKIRFRDRAVVLMYHRVVTGDEGFKCYSQDGIVIAPAVFEQQMRFLRKHFNVLSLEAFLDCVESRKTFDQNSCLVTFDDGWKDNFQNAYPVLKEIGIPAVIFLTTDFLGTRDLFWQERITELLCRLHDAAKKDNNSVGILLQKLSDVDIESILRAERRNLKDHISVYIGRLKEKSKEEIDATIQRLSELTVKSGSENPTEDAFMNWDEIRVMAGNGITFGSHGKSHAILTRLEKHEVEKEVLDSRALIEEKLETPVCSFSYPNGDYSEEVIDIVRHSGYRASFLTESGTHSVEDNPYRIRRINIHGDMTNSIPMFLARVAGLW